jgi:hypothetical protein
MATRGEIENFIQENLDIEHVSFLITEYGDEPAVAQRKSEVIEGKSFKNGKDYNKAFKRNAKKLTEIIMTLQTFNHNWVVAYDGEKPSFDYFYSLITSNVKKYLNMSNLTNQQVDDLLELLGMTVSSLSEVSNIKRLHERLLYILKSMELRKGTTYEDYVGIITKRLINVEELEQKVEARKQREEERIRREEEEERKRKEEETDKVKEKEEPMVDDDGNKVFRSGAVVEDNEPKPKEETQETKNRKIENELYEEEDIENNKILDGKIDDYKTLMIYEKMENDDGENETPIEKDYGCFSLKPPHIPQDFEEVLATARNKFKDNRFQTLDNVGYRGKDKRNRSAYLPNAPIMYYFDNVVKTDKDILDFVDKVFKDEFKAGFHRVKFFIDFGVIIESFKIEDEEKKYKYSYETPIDRNPEKATPIIIKDEETLNKYKLGLEASIHSMIEKSFMSSDENIIGIFSTMIISYRLPVAGGSSEPWVMKHYLQGKTRGGVNR